MDTVFACAQRKTPAHAIWRCLGRIGRTVELANPGNRPFSSEHQGDDFTPGQVADQRLKVRPAEMFFIMGFGPLPRRNQHPEPFDREAVLFIDGQDLANQVPFCHVWFQQNQGLFHGKSSKLTFA